MTDYEKMLHYLLKIIAATGRQAIKDHLLSQIGKELGDLPANLLQEINKLERALGQLDRMDDEERIRLGITPRTHTQESG